MKKFLRRSAVFAIVLLVANLFLGNKSNGQIVIDQFNRANSNTVGNSWSESETTSTGAQISTNQLRLGSSTSGRDYIVRPLYSSSLNTNTGLVTWLFNMRQTRTDPSGFGSSSYGVAFLLAGSGSDLTNGTGYAVVIGQSTSTDALRLVRYNGGLDADANLTDIISGSDFGAEYLAVKITYDPSNNNWQLFYSSNVSSFPDPLTATYTQIGAATSNSTYTGTNLPYIGCFWNHGNSSTDFAFFDNIYLLSASSIFSGAGNFTFIPPAGVSCIQVETWGAGGGGGGGSSNGGTGGGGGGYSKSIFSVTSGSNYFFNVGAGGTGGQNSNGTSGTSSWFNSNVNTNSAPANSLNGVFANGGGAGINNSTSNPNNGAAVGFDNTSSAIPGNTGAAGTSSGGGNGGNGANGGLGGNGSNNSDGSPGNPPGGGGGGSNDDNGDVGGIGANGQVKITWIDASNFNVSSNSPICSGTNATITLTSTTISNGTYNVNYTTTNPGATQTTPVTFTGGTATFSVSGLTGTPSPSAVTINYITFPGASCNTTLTGKSTNVTVNSVNTFGSPSSTPTLCQNISLTPVTIATTGATGIGSPSGLPAGVSASWASNTITISGTPTASGTFNYSIPLTGGCGTVNATGTITVLAAPTPTFTTSPAANICINSSATYTTQSGQSNYLWSVPGISGTDYTITSGGTSTDNSVTLTWLTTGSKIVTVNYTNANNCQGISAASSTTTVNTPPNATFTYGSIPAYYCLNGSQNPTPTISGNPGGSFSYTQFSGPAGTITLNPSTGGITLSSSSVGVYTVTYSVTVNGCTSTHSENIELKAPTAATLTYTPSSFCKSDVNTYGPTLTTENNTAVIGSYSAVRTSPGIGSLSIDDNSGTITPSLSDPGVYTVTYNFSPLTGECPNAVSVQVTIYANPAINNMTATTCSDGSGFSVTPVDGTNGTVPPGTMYSWTAPSMQAGLSGGTSGSGNNISGTLINSTSGPLTAVYTVTPTNGVCTGTAFTVTITVNPKPAVNNIAVSSPICSGSVAGFTVTPADGTNGIVPSGTTYSWPAPSVTGGMTGGASGSGASITGTLTNTSGLDQTATYTVTPTSGACVGNTFTVTVTVKSAPSITMSKSYICLGSSSQILAPTTGGTWVSNNPSVASVTNNGTVTGLTAGSVTFTFTDGTSDCSNTTASLTVDASCQVVTLTQPTQLAATIAANGPLTICAGQSSSITVTVSGGSGSYDVAVNGNHQTGAGPVFTFNVSPTTATTYNQSNVIVTDVPNACNSNTTGTVQIIVNPVTAISNGPTSYSKCIGETITGLSVTASGTGTLHYQWYSNTSNSNSGGTPVGSDQSTYTPPIDNSTAGIYYYYVVVSSDCGTDVPSSVATVTVNPLPTATLSYSGASTICSGTTANLTITFTGTAPFSLTYNDGTNHTISGINTNPYTLVVTPTFPNTTYTLISVSDANCNNSASGSATINVYGTTITSGACASCASPVTVCAGANPNSFSVGAPSGGDGNYTYQWQESAGCTGTWVNATAQDGITNTLSFNPPALSQSICYRLQITDGCGNAGYSDTKTYNVVPDPVSPTINPTPADGTTVCVGASVSATFNAGSGGTGTITDTYLFSTDGGATWNTYNPGDLITANAGMVGSNMIQISAQRTATGLGCANGILYIVKWSVAVQPVSGTLTKTPDVTTVCEGAMVSAAATAGSGGAGNISDILQYRFDGTGGWTTYTSTTNLNTTGHTLVEIQTYRTADGTSCTQSTPAAVSWIVRPTPTATISGTTSICQNETAPLVTITNPQNLPVKITFNINGSGATTLDLFANSSTSIFAPTGIVGVFAYNLVSIQYQDAPNCSNNISGTATVTVTKNTAIITDVTNPAPVCAGTAAPV
ncbi:MAG: Ig-like domain-containing protein [Bacteroidetes bacterium]|nr:Ig-like domain-containing protein [Bacteroidota bacterium]